MWNLLKHKLAKPHHCECYSGSVFCLHQGPCGFDLRVDKPDLRLFLRAPVCSCTSSTWSRGFARPGNCAHTWVHHVHLHGHVAFTPGQNRAQATSHHHHILWSCGTLAIFPTPYITFECTPQQTCCCLPHRQTTRVTRLCSQGWIPSEYWVATSCHHLHACKSPLLAPAKKWMLNPCRHEVPGCDYNAMVIDLLGPTIGDLFNFSNHKFSLRMVWLLADHLAHDNPLISVQIFDVKPIDFLHQVHSFQQYQKTFQWESAGMEIRLMSPTLVLSRSIGTQRPTFTFPTERTRTWLVLLATPPSTLIQVLNRLAMLSSNQTPFPVLVHLILIYTVCSCYCGTKVCPPMCYFRVIYQPV